LQTYRLELAANIFGRYDIVMGKRTFYYFATPMNTRCVFSFSFARKLSMHNKTIGISLLLLGMALSAEAQKKYKVMAVGFYNCENFFDAVHDTNKEDIPFTPNGEYHYTEEIYKQKVHNIATVIKAMGTDVTPDGPAIVGLAEVENGKVLTDLCDEPELKDRHYKYEWFYTPDVRGISTGMLYNPKYFHPISARPLTVPMEQIGQTRPTRDILYVYGVLAGDTVHVLVNHWPSKSGGETASAPGRRLAAGVDKHIVDSLTIADPNVKIIIVGDLNDNPTSEGVMEVLNAKADPKDALPSGIYNPWINKYNKGEGTENYRGEWNLIDQIMVSGGFITDKNNKWKYYKSEIYHNDMLVYHLGKNKGLPHRSFTINKTWDNGYSDHFPVLTYFVEE